jgi:hypothetical protein
MNREISTKDLQQLSEYLDGKLPEKERIQVEARLRSHPELREELEGLRRTHLMLRQLPRRRAPRNFFITPEMVSKRPTLRLFPVFRLASALAGLLLVVAFAGDLFFGSASSTGYSAPAILAMQAQSRNSSGLSESNPPIIMWGTPTPGGSFFGAGGGGGLATGMGGGPTSASSDTLPPTVSAGITLPATPEPQATQALGGGAPTATGPSVEGMTPPTLKAAAPQSGESTPAETAGAAQDQYQSGPVLGINPTEGAAEATALNHAQSHPFEIPRPSLHIVEGALALLAVLLGLAAFFFYRREGL